MPFGMLKFLETIGLISMDLVYRFGKTEPTCLYYNGVEYLFSALPSYSPLKLELNVHIFTAVGEELARLVKIEPDENYVQILIDSLKVHSTAVGTRELMSIQRADDLDS